MEDENEINNLESGQEFPYAGMFTSQSRWSVLLGITGKIAVVCGILFMAYVLLEERNNQLRMGVAFLVFCAIMVPVWQAYKYLHRSGNDLKNLETTGEETFLDKYSTHIFRYFLFYNILLLLAVIFTLYGIFYTNIY